MGVSICARVFPILSIFSEGSYRRIPAMNGLMKPVQIALENR